MYKELVPANFRVPQNIGTKIRRLREEMIEAAEDKDIKDFKGHEFKYTVSGDSVIVPDLAGNAVNGDTVTLTK